MANVHPHRRKQILSRFSGRCGYCGQLPDRLHIDHIVPRSRGGRSNHENLMPACEQCNLVKSNMDLEAFRFSLQNRAELDLQRLVGLQVCVRFGQIKLTPKPVKFHFEEAANDR